MLFVEGWSLLFEGEKVGKKRFVQIKMSKMNETVKPKTPKRRSNDTKKIQTNVYL